MTPKDHEVLNQWTAQVESRSTVEDFWGWLQAHGFSLRTEKEPYATSSLSDLLDRYFEVDRKALETARRALLETVAEGEE